MCPTLTSSLTRHPTQCYPLSMPTDDLLHQLDAVLVKFAAARLNTLLGAKAVTVPSKAPRKRAAIKPAKAARKVKRARQADVPTACPVMVNGKRCGQPTNGPRYSFACKEHVAAKSRRKDYASWKGEQAGK
jgi:hypothetical protein